MTSTYLIALAQLLRPTLLEQSLTGYAPSRCAANAARNHGFSLPQGTPRTLRLDYAPLNCIASVAIVHLITAVSPFSERGLAEPALSTAEIRIV